MSRGMTAYLLKLLRQLDYYEWMDCDGDDRYDELLSDVMGDPAPCIEYINGFLSD